MAIDTGLITNLVIGLAGVVCTGVLGYLKMQEKKKVTQAMNELSFQKEGLNFTTVLSEINDIYGDIDELMKDSCIDRFVILRAWNGELTPKWTTAVFQIREGSQKPVTYVHFELDPGYLVKLKEMYVKRNMVFDVKDLPEGAIRSVYESEGVKSSMWCYIGSAQLEGSNSKAMTYCSFSTHKDCGIDPKTATRCAVVAGRLKGFSLNFS